MSGAKAVAAGEYHCIALSDDGTVSTWGYNNNGQLGDGSTNISSRPKKVLGLTNIIAVAAGKNHSLALQSDGTLWAWGNNAYGQLGTGNNISSKVPVKVSTLSNIKAISTRNNHCIAQKNDSTVWTWGSNSYGQLGDGRTTDSNIPVNLPFNVRVNQISAGADFTMAMTSNGIYAWGNNQNGQLGIRNKSFSTTKELVYGTASMDLMSIGSGYYHASLIDARNGLSLWGDGNYGQLGNNIYVDRFEPMGVSRVLTLN